MEILLVEDSRFSRIHIETLLKKAGYENIISTSSAYEAFKILDLNGENGERVDLILMDIIMPQMNGIEACSHIKSHEHLKDIPVIMITAKTEVKVLEAAFNAGAMDFISKPLNETELMARIRSALVLKQETDRRKTREDELLKVTRLLEEANQKLRAQNYLDGLTGIANRRRFDEFIDVEWRRALRNSRSLSLIMIDIDVFKAFNDNYGHLEGDDCLKKVARTLRDGLKRPGDLAARYGGEEFVALLPETNSKGAFEVAEDLRSRVEGLSIPHAYSSVSGSVTISLGVASIVPDMRISMDTLIKSADRALYRAKQKGRNRVEVYATGINQN